MTATINPKIAARLADDWLVKKAELTAAQDAEMTARLLLIGSIFQDPDVGTNTYELEDGRLVKYINAFERSIQADREFDTWFASQVANGKLKEELVNYKPVLVGKEYNKLDKQKKALMSKYVITKPKSAQVTVA